MASTLAEADIQGKSSIVDAISYMLTTAGHNKILQLDCYVLQNA